MKIFVSYGSELITEVPNSIFFEFQGLKFEIRRIKFEFWRIRKCENLNKIYRRITDSK